VRAREKGNVKGKIMAGDAQGMRQRAKEFLAMLLDDACQVISGILKNCDDVCVLT